MDRPQLVPGLPRIWRGPSDLQLGCDPARAVSLRLPDDRAARLLDLLDGSRSERAVLRHAAGLGVPADQVHALLDTLQAAGLVLPAASLLPPTWPPQTRRRLIGEAAALALRQPNARGDEQTPATVLRRRASARVLITGHGRLGAAIAVALATAGVGHVHADLPGLVRPDEITGGPLSPADIGQPRRTAVTAAIQRAAPGTHTQSVRRAPVTLVVQLDLDKPVNLIAAAYAGRRQPHLAVTIREGAAVIGPFVPATGGPCLYCLDLHRRERDSGWPGLGAPRPTDTLQACAVSTALSATGYAVEEILTHVDGGIPQTAGVTTEITHGSTLRRRTWSPHPACVCAPARA